MKCSRYCDPRGFTVDFMMSGNGPIASLLQILVDQFGPIRDMIKSTVAAAGDRKVFGLTVPWIHHL